MAPPHADLLLDFLAGLPEEQVRRDRRAEEGDEDADIGRVEPDRRDQRARQDLDDVGPGEQGSRDVGKQGQGQPLEDLLDEAVAAEDLQPNDPQADRHDEDDRLDRHEQVDRCRDRADVRPRVQDVGDDEGDDGRIENAWVVLAEDARQALSGHQADLGAHVLDGRLHRQHREGRPERREAVLGAGLSVGPDARGIVVGRPGDEAGAERLAEALQRVPLGAQLSRLRVHGPAGIHPRSVGPGRCVRTGCRLCLGHGVSPSVRPAIAPAMPPADDRGQALRAAGDRSAGAMSDTG